MGEPPAKALLVIVAERRRMLVVLILAIDCHILEVANITSSNSLAIVLG
jgi:hypothetical protein